MAMAKALGHVTAGQETALEALCQAAETELARRLRPGVSPEDCGSAFVLACAWMALAGLTAGESAGVEKFTAGSLTVVRDGAVTLCRAVLQPALETREDWFQSLPTPLGTVRRDQWLYLGPPEVSLDGLGDGYVAWNNTQFEVRAAQPVCLGEDTIYWWALLAVRDPEPEDGPGETA